jgi:hypothetical protein
MSSRARIALLIGIVVVAVVGLVIARSGDDSNQSPSSTQPAASAGSSTGAHPATPKPPEIVVQNQQPVGGVKKITVPKNGTVRFSVRSDSAQEIHVHGYDFHKEVPANGSVSFSFPAKIDGSFIIELEDPGVEIGSLKVTP